MGVKAKKDLNGGLTVSQLSLSTEILCCNQEVRNLLVLDS